MRRILTATALLSTLAAPARAGVNDFLGLPAPNACSAEQARKEQSLEEKIVERRLAENEEAISEIRRLFPEDPNVVHVTLRALESEDRRKHLAGDLEAPYNGVVGEYVTQLEASYGTKTLVDFCTSECAGCSPSFAREVVPFARAHPEIRTLLVAVDASRPEVTGQDIAPFFSAMYGGSGFPRYIALNERGELLTPPTIDFEKVERALLESRPVEVDEERAKKGWFARARIAHEDTKDVRLYLRPATFVKGGGIERVVLDGRLIEDGGWYASPHLELLDFIEERTGTPFEPRDPEVPEHLLQGLNTFFDLEAATPEEIVGFMAKFHREWGENYTNFGRPDIGQRYLAIADELDRYRAQLPEGGERFSVQAGSCVTRGPPQGRGCDYAVSTFKDTLELFSTVSGIEMDLRDLPAQFDQYHHWNSRDARVFDTVDFTLLEDPSVLVTMEGDPTFRDEPPRITVTRNPDYVPEE